MAGIATELINAIRTHPEAAVQDLASGAMGILGAVVGACGTLLLGWYRTKGSVTLLKLEISNAASGTGRELGFMNPLTMQPGAKVLDIYLKGLILSTYQMYKAVVVEDLDLFQGWGRRARPIKTTAHDIESCHIDGHHGSDGYLPAGNFARLVLQGRWYAAGDDADKTLKDWDHIRLTLLVAPKRRIVLWHKVPHAKEEAEGSTVKS